MSGRDIGQQGRLGGEAAGQQRDDDHPGYPTLEGVTGERPSLAVDRGGDSPSYYDQPVVKEPVWIWSVPAYFYVGGVAAGASLIGAVAQLAGKDRHGSLIRRCRRLGMLGTTVGTGLLVHDLGRPSRFLNMLRVFRPTSAMSMGSWTLAGAGTLNAGSVVLPAVGAPRLGDAAALSAGVLAPALGTYTAVLLSDTAVPVYQAGRRTLPLLFGASALASATDVLELGELGEASEPVVRSLGIAAKVADLAAATAVERAADHVERVGRPLHGGVSGQLWRASKLLTALSLIVSLLPIPGRWRRRLSGSLGTLGAVASRFAVFHAGTASARDPRATFERQRAGHGAAATDGRAAVTGAGDRRATDRTSR